MQSPNYSVANRGVGKISMVIVHTVQGSYNGCISWFPDNVRGGAQKKVLDGLFNRSLITRNATDWFIAAEGYDALGRARPGPAGPLSIPTPKSRPA